MFAPLVAPIGRPSMSALLLPALLVLLELAAGLYECNECFCFMPLTAATVESCHSYDAKNQQFYFGYDKCLALQPGDNCHPKVFPSQGECERACARFHRLMEEWGDLPQGDRL